MSREIVLNVKSLVVRNHSEATRVITVESDKAGVITGADVQTDADVEIINKDHVITTLTDDVPFMMEMVVENGRGYVPSTEHSSADHEIGIIPIDAVFSPITRVRYEVEETRVGQKTNYDKLNLEIWTDGSINPELALVESAKILRKHLNPFVQYRELGPSIFSAARGGAGSPEAQLEAKLNMTLQTCGCRFEQTTAWKAKTFKRFVTWSNETKTQLLEVRNFGDTTLNEVREKLSQYGLHLGMRVPISRSFERARGILAFISFSPRQRLTDSPAMRHRRRGRVLGTKPQPPQSAAEKPRQRPVSDRARCDS